MHEWALAESVISTAGREAKKGGLTKVTVLKIMLGELQQIERDIFEFALKELVQQKRILFDKTKFDIKTEKAVLKCRVCDYEWSFEDSAEQLSGEAKESVHFLPEVAHSFIRCPECKSPDFEIVRGRGVWIDSVEGEK